MDKYVIDNITVVDSSSEPSTPDDNVYVVSLVIFDLSEIDRNTDTRKAFAEYVRLRCQEGI